MPLGTKRVVQRARGSLISTAKVVDKTTGEESSVEEVRPLAEATFDGPHAMISVEHGTSMSINFQSVTSRCSIQLPVAANEGAIEQGFQQGWATVEMELAGRAAWCKEVLETLCEARKQGERK